MSFLEKLVLDNDVFNVLKCDSPFPENLENKRKPINNSRVQIKSAAKITTELFSELIVSQINSKDCNVKNNCKNS